MSNTVTPKKISAIHKYMDLFYVGEFLKPNQFTMDGVCWIDIVGKDEPILRIGTNICNKFITVLPIDRELFLIESLSWFRKKYPEKKLKWVKFVHVSEYPHKV